ncbi:MAG: hypothetical protein JXQ75_16685 [Phycisphaerae bacterium]|nr:hypothetical protein [Phycisphaerae bacterium]
MAPIPFTGRFRTLCGTAPKPVDWMIHWAFSRLSPQFRDSFLAARGKRENSDSETPFLTVQTTGETPVPQFCHGLLAARGRRENSGSETPFLTVQTTGETPVPQLRHGLSGGPVCGCSLESVRMFG